MAAVDLTVGPPGTPRVEEDLAAELGGPGELVEEAPPVDPSVIRALLVGMGAALNTVVGDDDVVDHWRWTERELADLTPPLTRMVNATPRLRRLAAQGDKAAVAVIFAGYLGRNVTDAKEARLVREREAGGAEAGADGGAGDDAGDGAGDAAHDRGWLAAAGRASR